MARQNIRLKYLCSSFSTPIMQQEVLDSGTYAVYGASGKVGYLNNFCCKEPYLGIVKDGAGVGRINQYNGETSLLGTMAYLVPNNGVNINWLKYAIMSLDLGNDVGKTTIPHIYFSDYGNRVVWYVPMEQQIQIAAFLDRRCAEIDAVIERTKATIEEYKKLKQAVITEAVTKGVRGPRHMKDSGIEWIGEIPEEWNIYRIANIYDERVENGLEELPILTVSINTGVSDHEVADDEKDRIFVRSEDRTKYKRVYPQDLAYNMMRAWQGALGAVRVDGMVSPAYVVAKPKNNSRIDSRYIEALLRTTSATSEMHRYSRGIVDFRLRLYWPEFRNIRICLPSIEEQEDIANNIDEKSKEIDQMIARKENLIEELESYKKSLIYEYVTGKKEVPACP